MFNYIIANYFVVGAKNYLNTIYYLSRKENYLNSNFI